MRQYFNFRQLILRYADEFTAEIPAEGDYNDAGEWVEAEPKKITLYGAIISHREIKIFRSEGTLTGKDKALFMLYPLDAALSGAKVTHDNKVYSISDELENGEFTGVWKYTLKRCSAFENSKNT